MAGGLRDIIYNCKSATHISLKKEAGVSTAREKARLFVHLLFCDACKQFVKQSAIINKLLHQFRNGIAAHPPYKLSEERKKILQAQLDSLP